ncbi:MAG: AAA family ATPase, partial [Candidatus Aminicenantia bacterium]
PYLKDKLVRIIPDNDKIGQQHGLMVGNSVYPYAREVKIIELPGLNAGGDISDWALNHTRTELIDVVKETPVWERPMVEKSNILNFLRKGSELQNLDCKVEWIIKGLIPKQSIILLHGKGGIGKTWLALQLADCVSKGEPFMGLETKKEPVYYVDFENSLPLLTERVKKLKIDDVNFWHNSNETKPPKLDSKDFELYKELPPGLILIDTLRASMDRDENDSREMAFVMNRLKELRELGFTIILLHHTPKYSEKIYKGSTAIFDLSDHVLSLYKVKRRNFEVVEEEDDDFELEDVCYQFGTREKTRYEPFHIFLEFNPDGGFQSTSDPKWKDMQEIAELLKEREPLNTNQIYEVVKEELGIKNKNKVLRLLRKGLGHFWESFKEGKSIYYRVTNIGLKVYPYIGVNFKTDKTDNLLERFNKTETDNFSNTLQTLDNTGLVNGLSELKLLETDETDGKKCLDENGLNRLNHEKTDDKEKEAKYRRDGKKTEKTIRVKMLTTQRGSPDGIRVYEYKEGELYDLPFSLAEVFLKTKWAEEVKSEQSNGGDGNPRYNEETLYYLNQLEIAKEMGFEGWAKENAPSLYIAFEREEIGSKEWKARCKIFLHEFQKSKNLFFGGMKNEL